MEAWILCDISIVRWLQSQISRLIRFQSWITLQIVRILQYIYIFPFIVFLLARSYIYFKIRHPDSKEFKGNLFTSGPVQLIRVQFSLKRRITKRKRGCFIRSPGLLSLAQFSSDDCIVRLRVPLPTPLTSSPFVLFPLCRPFRCPILF